MKIRNAIAVGAVAGLLFAGGLAQAETIKMTMASSHPPVVAWVAALKDHVVPQSNILLKEAGSSVTIEWTEAYAGSLYKFQDTLEAVEEGITDVGWVGTLWENSKMPLQNITYNTPFVSDDLPTVMKVMNDLHDKMPELTQAWTNHNQIYLGASGIETYHVFSTTPIRTFEDLAGKKFMAAGAVGSWLRGTGAVPVDGGLPVYYNNIKTGVADGALISMSGGFPFKLHEVAPYITKVSLGAQYTGGMAMNLDTWKSLPPDVQGVFKTLGREYSVVHSEKLMQLANVFEQKMVEAGATVIEFPAAERKKWADALPDIGGDWMRNLDASGLPAKKFLQAYLDEMTAAGAAPPVNWLNK